MLVSIQILPFVLCCIEKDNWNLQETTRKEISPITVSTYEAFFSQVMFWSIWRDFLWNEAWRRLSLCLVRRLRWLSLQLWNVAFLTYLFYINAKIVWVSVPCAILLATQRLLMSDCLLSILLHKGTLWAIPRIVHRPKCENS